MHSLELPQDGYNRRVHTCSCPYTLLLQTPSFPAFYPSSLLSRRYSNNLSSHFLKGLSLTPIASTPASCHFIPFHCLYFIICLSSSNYIHLLIYKFISPIPLVIFTDLIFSSIHHPTLHNDLLLYIPLTFHLTYGHLNVYFPS